MRQINFPVTMTEIIVCTPTTVFGKIEIEQKGAKM